MYNPATRLLSILELLQSQGQISAQALAQTLEVDERSVRRYITMLRDLGLPIESERGPHGGYALRPGFRLPPLMFNPDEIVAVTLGLLLMRELGSVSALVVESAASKIERVLPERLWQKSQALQQMLALDAALPRTNPVSSQWMLEFCLAAVDQRCLSIRYVSARGQVSQRTLSPYGLVLHGNTWYLPAHCHSRAERRLFRLDRVQAVAESEAAFEAAAPFDLKAYVLNKLAQLPGMQAFEVIVHAPLETVADYIPAAVAMLEDEAGETLLRCYTDDPYWLARYLVRLELPFSVRQSESLRTALRDIATDILAGL